MQHAPDLAIAALADANRQQTLLAIWLLVVFRHRRGARDAEAATEVDALLQFTNCRSVKPMAQCPVFLHQIAAGRRIRDVAHKPPVGGDDEQAGRVGVEPSARMPALARVIGWQPLAQRIVHCATAELVIVGGDKTSWLVEDERARRARAGDEQESRE